MKTRRSTLSLAVVLAAPLAVTGCATQAAQELTETASYALLPPEQEEKLGQQVAAEFEREVQILDDPQVQKYVSELGEKVVAQAEVPEGIEIEFEVIDGPKTVNAVALPGGSIYVYSGLIRAADNEAELVSVLSHEVAHVTERHIASQLVTMYGLEQLQALVLGQDPGQISQLAAALASQGALLHFSREAEREADAVGLRNMTRAGWDPHGYVTFFEKLAQQDVAAPVFLRTHPAPDERVANARELIQRLGEVPDKTGEQRYAQIREMVGGEIEVAAR